MSDSFDLPQGSYHGSEICELVGLLILYEIEKENNFEKNKFGLHRLFLYKKTSTMV